LIRYLTVSEVIEVHRRIIARHGGPLGLRDLAALESAVAQPAMTFGGEDLYPSIIDKAAVLGFAIIRNHPFIDGNKRVGHAMMEVFLVLNKLGINATVTEQEQVILQVAAGEMGRDRFVEWLGQHLSQGSPDDHR
jgi:death on curing protein